MTASATARAGLIALALWTGGTAALVTSGEIDRRLHPGDYPLPYEPMAETWSDLDSFPPTSAFPVAPEEVDPVNWCAI